MKVVINRCYGGFGLSYQACMLYAKLAGFKLHAFGDVLNRKKEIRMIPYNGKGTKPFCIHYSKKPLTKSGCIPSKAYWSDRSLSRRDPILVQIVEELGDKANGDHARLHIVDIPDDVHFEIEEYDGNEWVSETHKCWS